MPAHHRDVTRSRRARVSRCVGRHASPPRVSPGIHLHPCWHPACFVLARRLFPMRATIAIMTTVCMLSATAATAGPDAQADYQKWRQEHHLTTGQFLKVWGAIMLMPAGMGIAAGGGAILAGGAAIAGI